jgi:hypothetical protein
MSLFRPSWNLQVLLTSNTPKERKAGLIQVLPDELIEYILEFVTLRDLASICRVSHDFNIFSNKEHLWKQICLRDGVTEQALNNGKPITWKLSLKRGRWKWDFSEQFSLLYSKEIKVYDNSLAVNCFTAGTSAWKTMRTTIPLQNTKNKSTFGLEVVTFGQYYYIVLGLSCDDYDFEPHGSRQVHSEGIGDYYDAKLKQKDSIGFIVEEDTITWYWNGSITKSQKLTDPTKIYYPSVSLVHQTILRIIPNWKPTWKSPVK